MYKLIKHRGINNKYIKENTYEGILKALESDNYIGVEFDVRSTLDNEFIIYHNPVYNSKLISATKYEELARYIPKLEDILKIDSNKIFLIEIKNINNNYDKLIKLLNKYSNKNIYVMSFSFNIIKKLNISNRHYKLGILNYILNTNNEYNILDFIAILNTFITDELLLKLSNYKIFSYGLFEKKKYTNIYYITDK